MPRLSVRRLTRARTPLAAAALITAGLAVGAPAASATAHPSPGQAATITAVAHANVGASACGANTAGGAGYGSSCTGNAGAPEHWCADFATWVWGQAGVDTTGLTPAAASFAANRPLAATPHAGDAVLFNYDGKGHADHVALVAQVHPDGTITTVGGNEHGASGNWAATSHVHESGPHPAAVGSNVKGLKISGYVSP